MRCPKSAAGSPWPRLGHVETKTATEPDPVRGLSVLLKMDARGAVAFAGRLRLSDAETQHLRTLMNPPVAAVGRPDRSAKSRRALLAWRRYFRRSGSHGLGCRGRRPMTQFGKNSPACPTGRPYRLSRSGGKDVLALGVPAGKVVGELLAEIERWWMDNDFQPGRTACLERLKTAASSSR